MGNIGSIGIESSRPTDYSYERVYSLDYSEGQVKKFLLRRDNHWMIRINHVLESLSLLDLVGNKVLDLGTSIGTFAIELAQRDYQVTGIDVDKKAICLAQRLAEHYGLSIDYIAADASVPETFAANSFHLIVAEDIFEHLHDDVLEKVLENCYYWLKPGGYLVCHTFPTRFDYIFHTSRLWLPLALLAWLDDARFCRLVELYHWRFLNPCRRLWTGKTFEESIQYSDHCNPLTATHLRALLEKVGLWVLKLETQNLYPWSRRGIKGLLFHNKQYFHRNITGVCWKPLW